MSRKKQTAKPETSRADKPKDRTGIYIAVIGLLGTITAAIIGNINVRTQFKLPVMATQTAEARAESTLFSATNPSTAFPSSISTTSTNGPPSIMPVLSITGALSTPSLALSTSTTLGVLSIKVLEGCGIHIFDINRDGQIVGSSKTDQREYLTEGTYDIFLKSDFGKDLARTGVLVQRGKETVVDFSGEMGALLLSSYPQFKMLLPYKVYNNNNSARGFLYSNSYFCGSPDKYTINLSPTYPNYSGYGNSSFTIGLFRFADIQFDMEIKAGEITVVEPDKWNKQLGVIGFDAKDTIAITIQVYSIQNGLQTKLDNEFVLSSSEQYWMLAGKYNIVITNPYSARVFENIEIKPGEKLVLPLRSP